MQFSLLQPGRNVGVDLAVTVLFKTACSRSLGTVRRAGTVPQVWEQTPALTSKSWPF